MDNIKVLFSEEMIKNRAKEIVEELYQKYQDEEVVFVCTLKGSIFFLCDLLKNYHGDARVEFVKVSSYSGTKSTGIINMNLSLSKDNINNKNVVIVEDIVDTGNTLVFLKQYINEMNPKTLTVCTLLEKRCKRIVDVYPDYYGFMVDDLFVIGYGLDYDGKYRNLPYVGLIEKKMLN